MTDVNLTIVYRGVAAHWAGVSTCGHVLMDERVGLYSDGAAPDLSWINNSTWGEMLEAIEQPLMDPCYGTLIVDFDQKKITDSTGAGRPFDLHMEWLAMTWKLPRIAPVTKKSLRGHLRAGRLSRLQSHLLMDDEALGETLPKTLPKAIAAYEAQEFKHGWTARFLLPPGWTYESVEA